MATADGFFRHVYDGCLSGNTTDIERRPYHRNCGCALHSNNNKNSINRSRSNCHNVSYPMRRAWSEGNLVIKCLNNNSNVSSPSSSPAPPPGRTQLGMFMVEED